MKKHRAARIPCAIDHAAPVLITTMDGKTETDKLLRECGAVLKRNRKHEVWQLLNGKTFVRPSTLSDSQSGGNNQLATLRKLLDLNGVRGQAGERREKIVKPKSNGYRRESFERVNSGLADKLLALGVADSARQTEIEILRDALFAEQSHTAALMDEVNSLLDENAIMATVLARPCCCWGCKLASFVRSCLRKLMLYS